MDENYLDDLRLPVAVVTRLIREALPPGVSISKEVKTAIARSASIFVLHATNYALDHAKEKSRKCIAAEDIFHAIETLECKEIEAPLRESLEAFRKQREGRAEMRKKKKAVKAQSCGDDEAMAQDAEQSDVEEAVDREADEIDANESGEDVSDNDE